MTTHVYDTIRRFFSVPRRGSWVCVGIGCVWAMLGVAAARGQSASNDEAFLDGLRFRGLYELAETYCQRQLAESSMTARRRAELTIEWSRALAEHAAAAPPERQEALWREASERLDAWLSEAGGDSRRPLVELQRALVALARGELSRQQSYVAADPGPLLDRAKADLRDAVGRLRPLVDEVDRLLVQSRQSVSRRGVGDSLSTEELLSLGRNVRFQLGRALMSEAECYDRQSADRAHALNQAGALLDELAGLGEDDRLCWSSRLARVKCHRLLSDFASAEQMLSWINQRKPPPRASLEARTETVRLALDQDQIERAIGLMQTPKELAGIDQADWDLCRLETCLAVAKAADKAGRAEEGETWRTRADQMLQRIESLHGPYWTRRAEMLLTGSFRRAGNLDLLVRAAKNAYLAGRLDEAVSAYDKASGEAARQGAAARSLDLGRTAATIEQKQGRHREAADRCRRLAMAMPQEAMATEIHAQAICNLAEWAKNRPDAALEEYAAWLEEHLRQWPASGEANRVRWWLGETRRYQGKWEQAILAYATITADDSRFADAMDAAGACREARLDQTGSSEETIRAADWFESFARTPDGRRPERLSPAQRSALLWAARLRLRLGRDGQGPARQWLIEVLAGSSDAPESWRREAETLLVVAMGGEGRLDEARRTLDQLAEAGPGRLLDVLTRLQRATELTPAAERSGLAELELRAVDLLLRRQGELTDADRDRLRQIQAGALATVGRTDEAAGLYESLIRARPRDARIREAYADALTARGDRRSLESALEQRRELEKHAKPGTAAWFEAKYAVAELHLRLGRPEQAEKILQLLELLHPDLGGPTMKPRFEDLMQRCQKKP